MAELVRALGSTTAEIGALVKSQQTANDGAVGTYRGLNRRCEERVFVLRGCETYDVKVGQGEYGRGLVDFLKRAHLGGSTALRKLGFRQ